jgi:hypothetical protein
LEKLFSFSETQQPVTTVTGVTVTKVINVSCQEIADPLSMQASRVGQILRTLGISTKPVKIDGKTKCCIVYDESKMNKLRKRYMPSDGDVLEVTLDTKVTGDTGTLNKASETDFTLKKEVTVVTGTTSTTTETIVPPTTPGEKGAEKTSEDDGEDDALF